MNGPDASGLNTNEAVPVVAFTVTVTASNPLNNESEAVNRNTQVPITPNEAAVTVEFAFAKLTVPGPLNLLHVTVSDAFTGNPSSLTDPASDTPCWI
jgi:hypothetical protein